MEELLLRVLLPGKELDVVDQQCIHRSVAFLELVDFIVLKRGDHLPDELFGAQVHDVGARVLLQHPVAGSLHEMGLADPGAAVDEQGIVVGVVGTRRDQHRRRSGHLVGFAFDEVVEGVFGTQSGGRRLGVASVPEGRLGRRPVRPAVDGGWGSAAPDMHGDVRLRGFASTDDLPDPIEVVLADPIADEVVRCEQPQARPILDGVEGADPRVELFRRQIDLKTIETMVPGR